MRIIDKNLFRSYAQIWIQNLYFKSLFMSWLNFEIVMYSLRLSHTNYNFENNTNTKIRQMKNVQSMQHYFQTKWISF